MQMQRSGGNNLDSQNATPRGTKALTKHTQQRAVAGALRSLDLHHKDLLKRKHRVF
jgi:hypothetical protein